MSRDEVLARRAARLTRWYPPAWRARYAEEFTAYLVQEMAERPRSWSRTVNVARHGLAVRLLDPVVRR